MSAKDELAKVIFDRSRNGDGTWVDPLYDHEAEAFAVAILAAGYRKPRVITTIKELDALQPSRSIVQNWNESGRRPEAFVIRDAEGRVYERDIDNAQDEIDEGRHAGWWVTGWDSDEITSATVTLPVTVLFTPEALS